MTYNDELPHTENGQFPFSFDKEDEPFSDYQRDPSVAKESTETIDPFKAIHAFNYKPRDIKAYLDRFVIQQAHTKQVLSVAICDHFNMVKSRLTSQTPSSMAKQNIVMIGPTGVGKTFLIKKCAELVGVPFVKSDATKFTETGYMGGDVEDLVRQLVDQAGEKVALAQYGIIYLDEVDKISASLDKVGKDVSGRGVQSNLLKLLEETEVPLTAPWDIQAQLRSLMSSSKPKKEMINTRDILFIMSGAFTGLTEIIRKRVEGSRYGFECKEGFSLKEQGHLVTTADLVAYGLEPEFVGRLPVRTVCHELSASDLKQILKESEDTIVNQYKDAFLAYGIRILFEESSYDAFSELAVKENTGARGLNTIFERVFRGFKFELPSTKIKLLVVDAHLVHHPEEALQKIMEAPERQRDKWLLRSLSNIEVLIKNQCGQDIQFPSYAKEMLIQQSDGSSEQLVTTLESIKTTLLKEVGPDLNEDRLIDLLKRDVVIKTSYDT